MMKLNYKNANLIIVFLATTYVNNNNNNIVMEAMMTKKFFQWNLITKNSNLILSLSYRFKLFIFYHI